MKERGGVTATIALLIAAIFGISYFPRKAAETAAVQESWTPAKASGSSSQAAEAAKRKPIVSCEQIAKRLTRFYPAGVPIPTATNACYAEGTQLIKISPPPNTSIGFALAIVPNPVQTHLPLMFDRMIEAIQQAAQDVNYSYDGSWFPWNHSQKSYETLSDEEQAARLEADLQQQPGIMVFRRSISEDRPEPPYDGGLIVFVVAEQPTGGISDAQFEHALQWISALQTTPPVDKLRIVGPVFSGSLSSLARELQVRQAFRQYSAGIVIFSGGTNADGNVKWFKNFLASHDPREVADHEKLFRFRTFLESDSLMTDRFLCYLQHEGYNLSHIAILSEDQTAFGKAASTREANASSQSAPEKRAPAAVRCQHEPNDPEGQPQPIYLYYPRDIASLRSAYEQQSIFNAGKQQANTPSTSLRGNLSEPVSTEHDTVRTYSGQLTPLAQEAVLFGITNILDAKKIEFIILRSSNSLDQLFLSEFLRRSYPSGRVVIDGADLLFRRGMEGASLRGVMLLSTYPLLNWTQDAIPPVHAIVDGHHLDTNPALPGTQKSSYRIFAQDLSEGTYIAARELFEQLPDASWTVPISDYGVPRSARSKNGRDEDWRPATWVSVVGHRQFWSIAVLNDNTENEPDGCPNAGADGKDAEPDCRFGPVDPDEASLLEPENPQTAQVSGAAASRTGAQKPATADAKAAPNQSQSTGGGAQPARRGVRTLPGEMIALLLGCVFLSLWHLYCCWKGSIVRPPRARTYFAPIPRVQHTLVIFIGSVVLGFFGVVIGSVCWLGFDALINFWAYGTMAS